MQYATPDEVYNRPAALFVAGFTGSPPMNLVPCTVVDGHADLGAGARLALPPDLCRRAGDVRGPRLGVRPENLRLSPQPGDVALRAEVVLLEPLGAETLVTVKAGAVELVVRGPAAFREPAGTALQLHVAPQHLHLFEPDGGRAL
jgi:multiple sugar transport system ATP-binding protein